MADFFMQHAAVRGAYQLDGEGREGKTFEQLFSPTSLEGLLFYIMSYCLWAVEQLFDVHAEEVEAALRAKTPHTTRWYAERALRFQHRRNNPRPLIDGTDQYDNAGYTDEEVAAMEIIAVASASDDGSGKVILRVAAAGETGNLRGLDEDELTLFRAYMDEVKDAGVVLECVSGEGMKLKLSAAVHYEPLSVSPEQALVEASVKRLLSSMTFSAALSKNAVVDAIQQVVGIRLVQLNSLTDGEGNPLGLQTVSPSGYFTIADGDLSVEYVVYKEENVQ
jgi:hypothetical protein